jgi:hypothetical protein
MSAFRKTICEDLYIKAAFEEKEDCYEQGCAASGQMFQRSQNPYPVGTAQREWWDAGFCEEQDELGGEK